MFVHMLIPEHTGALPATRRSATARVPAPYPRVPTIDVPDPVLQAHGSHLRMAMIGLIIIILLMPFSQSRADAAPRQHAISGALATPAGPEDEQESERDARELLLNAKDALSSGNIRYLRARLGGKVYLNLFTGINGYYSAEQAYLILESFFSTYTPISFSFSSRNFSIRNPYGFGPLTYERRGRRGSAEMFISLAQVGDRWVINQITVATR